MFLVNSQAERLISVLKERLTSLLHSRKAPSIQPVRLPSCTSRNHVIAICSKPGFLWRCQLLFHTKGEVHSWEVWAEHDGASLLLGSHVLEREFCGSEFGELHGLCCHGHEGSGQGCPEGRPCSHECAQSKRTSPLCFLMQH